MRVEILFFQGCPNHEPTVRRIRDVAAELNVEADIHEVEIATTWEAIEHRFLGSPTVLIDGVDAEPAARSRADYGMACRMYAGTGVPSKALLVAALTEAGIPPAQKVSNGRFASWFAAASVFSAVAASACCWLPLVLIAFGISGGAVAAAFEVWRPVLLPFTFVLLGVAFFLTYRAPKARSSENTGSDGGNACCAIPTPNANDQSCCPSESATKYSLKNLNKVMLWVVTAFALAFAFFPNYVGALLGGNGSVLAARGDLDKRVVNVEGMTCEACAVSIRKAVEAVPGVAGAEVSFEKGNLIVAIPKGAAMPRSEILAAISRAGYSGCFTNPDDAAKEVDPSASQRSESPSLRFFRLLK